MGGAFGRIARLLRRPAAEPGEPEPDAELLGRFVRSADQSAFELLVWRHAVMVFGVCRRVVRDDHLAEDAFQATFLVLARKGGSVRGSNVAGWLFRVARRVALRAAARTRARRETPLAESPVSPPLTDDGEALAILDEEIARLPERFRLPVVLCYLGGRSTEDAARVLGCPRGTVLSRLATARRRLAARLTRRGVTVPATLLSVAAVPSGLGAVSGLVPGAVRTALGKAAGGSAVVLAQGVITAMNIGKTITAAGVFMLAVGLVSGVGLVASQGPGPETVQKSTPVPAGKVQEKTTPQPPAAKPPVPGDTEKARQERIRNLERIADQFRAEIAARERQIRTLAEGNSPSDSDAAKARLQRTLTKLDDEVFALEKEVLDAKAQLGVLQARMNRVEPERPAVAPAVEADPRVAELAKQRAAVRARLEEWTRLGNPEGAGPAEMKRQLAALEKQLEEVRARVKPEVEANLRAAALKPFREKLADLEDRLTAAREVLEIRKKQREDIEQLLALRSRAGLDVSTLMRELEPQREHLRRIETQLLELRLSRELGTPPPARADNNEAKLDRLIREMEELRQEVRELRKP